jgi:hypothetical protein
LTAAPPWTVLQLAELVLHLLLIFRWPTAFILDPADYGP